MKSDLEGLDLTKGELKRLIGSDIDQIEKIKNTTAFKRLYTSVAIGIFSAFITGIWLSLNFRDFNVFMLFIVIIIGLIISWVYLRYEQSELQQKRVIIRLLDEVEKYNQLLANIKTLDQLEAVGNPIKLNDRSKVIEAIKITRKDLVRALNTERILRENPKFKPEEFAIDLTSLRSLQVSEQASEWGRLLNETLQVAVDVQTEMRKLQDRR